MDHQDLQQRWAPSTHRAHVQYSGAQQELTSSTDHDALRSEPTQRAS